jgi:hypothetical protein
MSSFTATRFSRPRSAAPFVAAVAISLAAGIGLAVVPSDDVANVRLATPAAKPKDCVTAGITAQSGREGTCVAGATTLTVAAGTHELVLPDRRVTAVKTVLTPATTPSGVARARARLTVLTRVQNDGSRALTANPGGHALYLSINGEQIRADSNADTLPDALRRDRPIAPGQSTQGVLRFELVGSQTRTLMRAKTADLGVAGPSEDRRGVIRLKFR